MKKTFIKTIAAVLTVLLLGTAAQANSSSLVTRDWWGGHGVITEASVGQTVEALFSYTLTNDYKSDGAGGMVTLDWGDGTSIDIWLQDGYSSMGYSRTHEYASAGTYTLSITPGFGIYKDETTWIDDGWGGMMPSTTRVYDWFCVNESTDIAITSNAAAVPAPGAIMLAMAGVGFARRFRR